MWPAPCEYHAAHSAREAVDLLGELPGAVVLAGGLSLVPAMRRRLRRPAHLVDINPAGDLAGISEKDGVVTVGATCRQAALAAWAVGRHPLLAGALAHVGTPLTRERGTVAGIVANGDPATQLAAVCAVLGATAVLRDAGGERRLPASRLFAGGGIGGPALLAAVEFPAWHPGDRDAFLQAGRRAVGSAMGGVAARVRFDAGGTCERADVAPYVRGHDGSRLDAVGTRLAGTGLSEKDIAAAADIAAGTVPTASDVLATAGYRTHLVRVLVRRALTHARRTQEAR
ncbi:MAG TPA: FAD binding domain-containing protein [Actinophytocola sp.]|jgi:carbon-monoxide dehydrogenase medium subunit|nr:FAD binding domain-containing protein [Actinophytocola sp.]